MTPDTAWKQFEGIAGLDRYPLRLLGIRGYRLSMGLPMENDVEIYDDLICICEEDKIEEFEASTDPGQYYINHPQNPHGCAQLACGLWWYSIGMHQEVHVALIQDQPVKVNRLDEYGVPRGTEDGFFGINIHSGGPEYQVGRFSAGCQVIKDTSGAWGTIWSEFIQLVGSKMNDYGQTRIPYLLIDKLKALPT